MGKKEKTVYFYHLETKEENIDNINNKFNETYQCFKNGNTNNVLTVSFNEKDYYIDAVDKCYPYDDDKYAWLISVSEVDPSKEIEIGNLDIQEVDKRNEKIETSENQGPVVKTQILYDKNTCVIAIPRTNGGLNITTFTRFLRNFCDVRGLKLAIIIDKGKDDLENIISISKLEFNISNIQNMTIDERVSELSDLKNAIKMGSDNYKATMVATSLNLNKIKDKVKFILQNAGDADIKKLGIEGRDSDGIIEPIDLVAHKLHYHGSIEYSNTITTKNVFEFLKEAYYKKFNCFKDYMV